MNGIYILKMKYGYKVAYSDRYEEMIGRFDDTTGKYKLNGSVVAEVFNGPSTFLDYDYAEQEAMKIASRYPETDDGIFCIKNCEDMTFSEIVEN